MVDPIHHKCKHCGIEFADAKQLRVHRSNIHGTKFIPCHLCDAVLESKFRFSLHFDKTHRPYKCSECERSVPQLKKFKDQFKNERMLCVQCHEAWTRSSSRVERQVADYLAEHIDWPICRRDRPVGGEFCGRARPDVLLTSPTRVLLVEVDEHQHRGYDPTCERVRLDRIYSEFPGKEFIVIRFNPHGYKGEGRRPKLEQRLETLVRVTREAMTKSFGTLFYIYYLYYSADNPVIVSDVAKSFVY